VEIAASNGNYGTVQFGQAAPCQRWIANGVTVFHRVSGNRWKLALAASSYRCPVAPLPTSVQRDLGLCPLASAG
jgi:hypothetical protein